MRIGLRMWKTAAAVAISISLCRLLGLEHPVFAGVAAIICLQPTVAGSLRSGIERMQATVIGAAFALGSLILLQHVAWLVPVKPALVAITSLLVMVAAVKLGRQDSLVLAAATVVVVMVLPKGENIYSYAASRTVITLIGVVVATTVNAALFPPDYTRSIRAKLLDQYSTTESAFRLAVESFCHRDAGKAEECIRRLESTAADFDAVDSERQWLEEENRNLNPALRNRRQDLRRCIALTDCVEELRKTTNRIAVTTKELLVASPHYVGHSAEVYDILWELAQTSVEGIGSIRRYLREWRRSGATRDIAPDELARTRLVAAIRAAHRAPRDIFPLIEVAAVAHEIRWSAKLVTDTLNSIE